MNLIIIGCGVSGLSCGIRLLEAGYGVRIWARDLPPHTTSNVAALAFWPNSEEPSRTPPATAALHVSPRTTRRSIFASSTRPASIGSYTGQVRSGGAEGFTGAK